MPTTTNPFLDDAAKLAKAAELLRQSADAMHDRRQKLLATGAITAIEFRANVVTESELRTQVSEMVLAALAEVVIGGTDSQENLEDAIAAANAEIATLAEIRHGVAIFASLIGLAAAIAAMQPAPIATALVAVRGAVETG